MKEITKESIDLYVSDGISPGGFLTAVLKNDLFGAMGYADEQNRADLFEICSYIYNEIPSVCWGNEQNMNEWMRCKYNEKQERLRVSSQEDC